MERTPNDSQEEEQAREAQEIIRETQDDGVLAKLGQNKTLRAAITAAGIALAGAGAYKGGEMLDGAQEKDVPVNMVSGGAEDRNLPALEGGQELFASNVSDALKIYFPSLELSGIRVTKQGDRDGYRYLLSDQNGGPVEAISKNGVGVELRYVFAFDNGAVNLGNEAGEVLTMQGISDGLNSIPANKK